MGRRGRPPYPDILTPREWEVLELLSSNLTNQEIGERLGISTDGAKYHVSEIIGKLGVADRREAAAWGRSNGRRRLALPALFGSLGGRIAFGAAAAVALGAIGVLAWGLLTVKTGAVDLGLKPGVYVFEPARGKLTRVADSPTICRDQCGGQRDFLSWSPDSSELLINDTSGPVGGVRAISADGRNSRPLALAAWDLTWLPTGDLAGFGGNPETGEAASLFDPRTAAPRTAAYGSFGSIAFSVDGKWLLATRVIGGPGLDLIETATAAGRRLLDGNFSYPAWSPSSESFAVNFNDGIDGRLDLAVYARDGALLSRTSAGQRPVWSPDGRKIAATDYRIVESVQEPWVVLTDPMGQLPPRDLTQGGFPQFAADSKSVIFLRNGELWQIRIDGKDEHKLVASALPMIAEAHWSPDGRRIAFIAGGGGGSVFTIGADGSGERFLTPGARPVASPDGSRLAFFYNSTIFVMGRDGNDIKKVGDVQYSDAISPCTSGPALSWSPDGKKIAYWRYGLTDPPIAGGVVWVWDGSAVRRVGNGYGPVWTPDGKSVAYSTSKSGARLTCAIDTVQPPGGQPATLVAGALAPGWTADGRYLAFVASDLAGPLFADLTIATGDGKTVLKHLGPSRGLAWSPDGVHYVFVRIPSPPVAPPGSPVPPVVPPDATAFMVVGSVTTPDPDIRIPVKEYSQLAWSPDGRRIAYTSFRDSSSPPDIFILDTDHPESPRYVTSGNGPQWLDNDTLVFYR